MEITSSVFKDNERIPQKYTCDGEDISPPLSFSNIPRNAQSLVLTVEDPDALSKTWVHWIMFNIPPTITFILEDKIPPESMLGKNDFARLEYGGPCPPSGIHRYIFHLYALNKILDLEEGVLLSKIQSEMKGCIIEECEMTGLYEKK